MRRWRRPPASSIGCDRAAAIWLQTISSTANATTIVCNLMFIARFVIIIKLFRLNDWNGYCCQNATVLPFKYPCFLATNCKQILSSKLKRLCARAREAARVFRDHSVEIRTKLCAGIFELFGLKVQCLKLCRWNSAKRKIFFRKIFIWIKIHFTKYLLRERNKK